MAFQEGEEELQRGVVAVLSKPDIEWHLPAMLPLLVD
jgi:hypothetical protein